MIVFYTKYNVIDDFNIEKLLNFAFDCVNGMKNVPESFKNRSWNGNESGEWKEDRNTMAYEIDVDSFVVAFRVGIVDLNDELWTTDMVLNEKEHEIQLRLAREKRVMSVEYDQRFKIPYMFKKIIRDGFGGNDLGIPVSDKPIYIDEDNIDLVIDLITKCTVYSMPVIYVSHPFATDEYGLDVVELAKDMAGSAHVFVEKSSEISKVLKERTDSKNAYNGAIDIFCNGESFRYFRWSEVTANQFRYKISRTIYSRMAMRNIDDDISLSAIRLKNKIKKLNASDLETQRLSVHIEELQDKCKELQEYFDFASEEVEIKEKTINELENENFDLKNKLRALSDALSRKQGNEINTITFEYSENQFYDDEIKRIILECINNVVLTYGTDEQERRDFHVLKDIVEHNEYSDIGNTIKNEMLRILKKNKLNKADISDLKEIGFDVQQGSHDKYIFYGDSRYIITVSNSPSDYRGGENLAHDAVNLIFGRT